MKEDNFEVYKELKREEKEYINSIKLPNYCQSQDLFIKHQQSEIDMLMQINQKAKQAKKQK